MELTYDFESEIDYEELCKEHLNIKRKKSNRRNNRKHKTKRLCSQLINHGNWKPSIWADGDWNPKTQKYEYSGRVKRAKHSNQQKWMKRYSNRVIRRNPENMISQKGNYYKKQFDYWWTWL